ncbi:MAG: tRNA (N(6)-L-threonylcarbamoyladenosine(37)-C(2))-methylthiotransferase [Candidatus Bathyarchaeota archaeon]|nr:MAG: tRNA (N(6)-L-threonylcarbamoyladenosine(37)-C(2))-methylthiotransferase [Candidatus Bathyarchaeota archaeon]
MRVLVKSYGCSANLADGEVLAGCLAKAGYDLATSASEADVMVYNTCAVKGPTENRIIETLKRVPLEKKVIVAGCLPLINFERLRREVCFDGAVGPAAGEEIVNVVRRVLDGEKVVALETALNAKPKLSLPKLKLNPVISVVPVNYGCMGVCAYCCVVFARGQLRSYSIRDVTQRVRRDLTAGAKEVWITSQDTACYGRDIDTNLAALLEAVGDVEGDFRVRLGMMTPSIVIDILDDLIAAFENKKIFKFVHLPVQSGDDRVLKRMRRFYKVQDFKDIVNVFRAAFPDVTLATDIICGFPGETKEAFENTLRLIGEVKPDIVNVSKFFARPRTAAAAMHDDFVELTEIKRRSTKAAKLVKRISLERNQRWIDWTGEILIDEKGKVPGSWIGRNFTYKPITVKNPEDLLGKTLRVKIAKAFSTYLSGEIC